MKRLLLLLTLLAVALPGTASAAGSPCRNQIFNDWYPDGKIASSYSVGCYRDALKHLPTDAAIYSSLGADVRAAMRAAIRRSEGLSAPKQVGHGAKAIGAGDVKGALASISNTKPSTDGQSSSGIVATASAAPTPILVLGGVALALVAAGGIGAGVRHARSRKS